MANILKIRGNFKKTWASAPFRYFQEKRFAHPRCRRCDYLSVCNGACPIYWEQVGYEELLKSKERVLA